MEIIVLIPIYKELLDKDEEQSLKQAFKVLSQYKICFICPDGLDLTEYKKIIKNKEIYTERFSTHFFKSTASYSNLLVTNNFYKRFSAYDYCLIYQLDAWVFYDNLKDWCEKGYDYIGAPWFENYKTKEEGANLWRVGNGGLSLRKIEYFLKITDKKQTLYSFKSFLYKYFGTITDLKKGISLLMYRNFAWYRKRKKYFWEDVYFCELNYNFNTPEPRLAAEFSFEKSPAFLYTLINKLPFGCHAWRKNQYEEFWKYYIPRIQDNNISKKHENIY